MDAEERRMAALAWQPDRRERELQAKHDAAALAPDPDLDRLEKIMEETNEDQG